MLSDTIPIYFTIALKHFIGIDAVDNKTFDTIDKINKVVNNL